MAASIFNFALNQTKLLVERRGNNRSIGSFSQSAIEQMFQFYVYMNALSIVEFDASMNKLDQLNKYGCHCDTFDSNITNGEPLDLLDAACLKWKQCKQCVVVDSETCSPVETGQGHKYGQLDFVSLRYSYPANRVPTRHESRHKPAHVSRKRSLPI